jgi:hypothetical protein
MALQVTYSSTPPFVNTTVEWVYAACRELLNRLAN